MSFNKTATLLACILGGLCTQSVMAADSGINVSGNVVASPCTVDAATKTLAIPLGDVQASVLAAAASSSAWTALYNLTLSSCPATTSTVNATFSGTADTNDTNGYKNAGSGSAAVSVQLAKTDGTTFLKNGASFGDTAVTSGKVTFPIKARMYTKAGSVAPGAVSAAISVAFTYK